MQMSPSIGSDLASLKNISWHINKNKILKNLVLKNFLHADKRIRLPCAKRLQHDIGKSAGDLLYFPKLGV